MARRQRLPPLPQLAGTGCRRRPDAVGWQRHARRRRAARALRAWRPCSWPRRRSGWWASIFGAGAASVPAARQGVGLLVGFGGILMLVWPDLLGGRLQLGRSPRAFWRCSSPASDGRSGRPSASARPWRPRPSRPPRSRCCRRLVMLVLATMHRPLEALALQHTLAPRARLPRGRGQPRRVPWPTPTLSRISPTPFLSLYAYVNPSWRWRWGPWWRPSLSRQDCRGDGRHPRLDGDGLDLFSIGASRARTANRPRA